MASQIVALPVYSGFSVCDLKVNNKAQGHVTVSIHEGSPTGALACSALRVEAGESKSFAGVALTEGANYVDIHTDGTCNLSGSLTYTFATAPAAQQTRTAVKINPQSADIYAEGVPATFPSEDGKTVYTGAELQRLDLHAAAHGWPLDGQKYLVGQCVAYSIPVRHYGKVLSVCG